MDRAALRAMQETLRVAVPRMNADAARDILARTAEAERARVLAEQTGRAGIAPTGATVVDGRRNADPATVRPDGYILLEWGYVPEVAKVALAALREAGPRDTGDWALTLAILADGREVEERTIPHMAQTVHIVATQPYSRRLEIGKTRAGDPFVLDDSDYRMLERTAKRMAPLFREVAKIDFTYVDLEGAWQLTNASARSSRSGGGQVRYPAIRIVSWQVQ